ncbi:DUF1992 domain-containing protein [Microbacterium terricola]|uniref:DnaJ homologue subfamily C member 28 conserved domain-containing protein n=1 Tax=Microbacterium terricola TaxID=344163 RepID=A0ABM8E2T1_9MICO|nr:DUF1992 domain-containing protein [Microbacterium terricola]UYK40189.1 DUF1992 domain-containing protein [Microbacterium terricola]BDV32105.1 hypothetical protein Microterr_27650 [Microbacterium terricola]
MSDAMHNAARYAAQRAAGEVPSTQSEATRPPVSLNAENKSAFVENAIQQAIRRGEFDDLPGAGKPLEGLGTHHDPDWWIRRKIETEKLTGLGPPALSLRTENLELDARLDLEPSEALVREIVDDFNRRVIEARRQLQGGPPVVTPTRDVDAEVRAWRERRIARAERAQQAEAAGRTPPQRRRPWFRR